MNDGFETTAQFKLFTMSGETQILNSSNKMRLNDKYGQDPKTVVDTLGGASLTPQIVVYETNSNNNITAIETAKDNTGTGAPNVGEFTMNVKKDEMTYKSASGKLDNVAITDDTVIFDIPEDAALDTDKYSIRNKSTLSNDSKYDAIIYDLQENYTANVVVITSSGRCDGPESRSWWLTTSAPPRMRNMRTPTAYTAGRAARRSTFWPPTSPFWSRAVSRLQRVISSSTAPTPRARSTVSTSCLTAAPKTPNL